MISERPQQHLKVGVDDCKQILPHNKHSLPDNLSADEGKAQKRGRKTGFLDTERWGRGLDELLLQRMKVDNLAQATTPTALRCPLYSPPL